MKLAEGSFINLICNGHSCKFRKVLTAVGTMCVLSFLSKFLAIECPFSSYPHCKSLLNIPYKLVEEKCFLWTTHTPMFVPIVSKRDSIWGSVFLSLEEEPSHRPAPFSPLYTHTKVVYSFI